MPWKWAKPPLPKHPAAAAAGFREDHGAAIVVEDALPSLAGVGMRGQRGFIGLLADLIINGLLRGISGSDLIEEIRHVNADGWK